MVDDILNMNCLPDRAPRVNRTVNTEPTRVRYLRVMNTEDDPTPLPPATGKTRSIVGRLRSRREQLGLSQAELGERVFRYANRMAERYGEAPRWGQPISRSAISKWEAMFPADPEKEVPSAVKDRRQSFSIFDYGCWARALGLRLVVDLVEVDENAEVVTLTGPDAEYVAELLDLDSEKRELILSIARSFKK